MATVLASMGQLTCEIPGKLMHVLLEVELRAWEGRLQWGLSRVGGENVQVLTQPAACTLGLGPPAPPICFPPTSALPSLALFLGLEKVLKEGQYVDS